MTSLAAGNITAITFTSASTVRNFLQLLGPDSAKLLSNVKLASIGPITTAALRKANLQPTIEAKTSTIPGLIDAILSAAKKT